MVLWLVGLSGAGKTTIARHLLQLWRGTRPQVVLLDGEALREAVDGPADGRGHDLAARSVREERIARLCAMLDRQGLDVICAVNSVDQHVRDRNRQRFATYFEVYVATPLEVCVVRDPDGLYLRALQGSLHGVVGFDLPYSPPRSPDMVVDNGHPSAEPTRIAERILGAAHRKRQRRLDGRHFPSGAATAGAHA